jgi:hypothetical protein
MADQVRLKTTAPEFLVLTCLGGSLGGGQQRWLAEHHQQGGVAGLVGGLVHANQAALQRADHPLVIEAEVAAGFLQCQQAAQNVVPLLARRTALRDQSGQGGMAFGAGLNCRLAHRGHLVEVDEEFLEGSAGPAFHVVICRFEAKILLSDAQRHNAGEILDDVEGLAGGEQRINNL